MRWFEHSDTSATWLDNWMCVEELTVGTAVEPTPTPGVVIDPVIAVTPADPTEVPGEAPETSMQLETVTGCSTGAGQMALFGAIALLLRRRR